MIKFDVILTALLLNEGARFFVMLQGLRFYRPLYYTDDLRWRDFWVLRFYQPLCYTHDLRWLHLSSNQERYGPRRDRKYRKEPGQ